MRAAFQDLARDLDVRLAGVVAQLLTPAAWILRDTARLRRVRFVNRRPPICGPFPYVADHVVEAVAVGRKRGHGRRALVTVETQILAREFALPSVGHVAAVRCELIAPSERRTVKPA